MAQNRFAFWFPFAIVFFEIATYLAVDMYLPGLPMVRETFQISQESAQSTILTFFLGSASMQLVVGPLSDRFGRKIILLIGAFLYAATSFNCAYTTSITLFCLLRFIQGATVCVVVVAGYSAIHEYFETKKAIKIVSVMGSVSVLAPAFGPVLGALVIEFASWQMIFIIFSLWGVVSFGLLSFAVPQTQKEKFPLHIQAILKDYWHIAWNKQFLNYTLCFCFVFLSLICWVVESPFLLIETFKKSPLEYGLIQLYVFGFFIVGAQITAYLINRLQPTVLVKIGIALAFLGSVCLVILSFFTLPLHTYLLAMILITAGSGMAFGPLSRLALESCQVPMGRRMAIFSSYMSFFGVFATLLVRMFHTESIRNLAMLITFGVVVATLITTLAHFFAKKQNVAKPRQVGGESGTKTSTGPIFNRSPIK